MLKHYYERKAKNQCVDCGVEIETVNPVTGKKHRRCFKHRLRAAKYAQEHREWRVKSGR